MTRAVTAVITLALALAGCGRVIAPAPEPTPPWGNSLRFMGGVVTDSSKAETGTGNGCAYRPAERVLLYQTDALDAGTGGVVRLVLNLALTSAEHEQLDAATPVSDGIAPARIILARSATAGAGNSLNARAGRITVDGHSQNLDVWWGTIDAIFPASLLPASVLNPAQETTVDGDWVCRVMPTS